ncbi:HD domain-containing phosphohydrolase [Kosmotoga sp. DU53]|uniref:HD domain-containing phosphohydrolase n=1 Tax=Kosmotoga sp. DU53 TaxID=1310160 RepID=UPI0007C4A7E3|nr:HD domain-containing phosphohydrolase [Kosmotoga sp. DU53]
MKKSVRTYINILLYVTIASIGVIGAMLLLFGLASSKLAYYEKIANDFSKINTMVLEVGRLHNLYHDNKGQIQEVPEYAETLSKLSKELRELEKYSSQIPISFSSDEILPLITDEYQYLRFATILKDLQREVENWVYDRVRSVNKLKNVALYIIIASLGIIVTVLLFIWRSFKDYVEYVQQSMENIDSFLEHEELKTQQESVLKETEEVRESTEKIINELKFDRELLNIPTIGTLEDVVPNIFETLNKYVNADRIAFAFLDELGNVIAETAVSKTGEIRLRSGFVYRLDRTTLSRVMENRRPRIINDLQHYYENVHKSEATRLILEEGMRSSITVPIFVNHRCIGFFFVNSAKANFFTEENASRVERFVRIIKGLIYNSYINQELIATTARTFADIVEKKDLETGEHLTRVSLYSYLIASRLAKDDDRLTPKFIREVLWFSPLHDIGKVGIPDKILLKPGKLTKEEFEIMKTHVIIGEGVLQKMSKNLISKVGIDFMKTARDVIIGHHEKWDGSGYPYGLKGEQIPLAGRIVAVADVFDALTSRRPYKPAFGFETALKMLRQDRGKRFDPVVLDAFFDVLDEVKRVYELHRDKG